MRARLMQLPARTRGLVYVAAGIVLAVVGALIVDAMASAGAEAGVDVNRPGARKAVGLIGAPFAIAMAGGVALTYIGLIKVAIGAPTDRIQWDGLTTVGLLYALGFVGALVLTGYVVLIRWEVQIF